MKWAEMEEEERGFCASVGVVVLFLYEGVERGRVDDKDEDGKGKVGNVILYSML